MKKRFLCLIVALLMVLPMILASCSDVRSDEEIIAGILGGDDAPKAMTLSLWIPTDSDTDSDDFNIRLEAVENAINEILVEKNFTTQIDIIAVKDSEYEKQLSDRFVSMGNNIGKAYSDGQKYKNEIDYYYPDENNTEDFIYTLKYPKVLDYQLDLFLIRGYDNFVSYYEKNYLSDRLDSYTKSGSDYSNITKLIRPNILEQMKLDGKLYALPNNHLYASEYQYIAIKKDIFDSFDFNLEDINDIYSCEGFINAVGEKIANGEITNTVPFVGTMNDAPNASIYDEDVLIGAGHTSGNISNIYTSEEYTKFVSLFKRLSEKGCVSDNAGSNNVAVQFVYGTTDNVEETYSDDYYLIKSSGPVATTEDVFESMFAISSYSIEYERSMKFLYLLQSDVRIRTLLQYGIEGEDYTVVYDDVAKENVIKVKDNTPYKMNILYTGNGYYTYPGNGLGMSDWNDVKDTNMDLVVDPFVCFDNILNSDRISAAKKEKLAENKQQVVHLISNFVTAIDRMTSEEFDSFITVDFITMIWEELEFYNEELGFEKEDMLDDLFDQLSDVNYDIEDIQNDDSLTDDEKAELLKEIEFEKHIITSKIRDVYTYGYSSVYIQKYIKNLNDEISFLEQKIQAITDDEELSEDEKLEEIQALQEDISELEKIIAYCDVNSTEDESNVQNEILQSILRYIDFKSNEAKDLLEANLPKFTEISSVVDALEDATKTASIETKPLIFGTLTSLNNSYLALESSIKQYNASISNYEKLITYLTAYVSNEAIDIVMYNEFVTLFKELIDIIDDDVDFGDDLIDGENIITIEELELYADYVDLFEDILSYHNFVLEYVYGINDIYEAISSYDFAFDLYTNNAYVEIIEFYNSLR